MRSLLLLAKHVSHNRQTNNHDKYEPEHTCAFQKPRLVDVTTQVYHEIGPPPEKSEWYLSRIVGGATGGPGKPIRPAENILNICNT